MGVMETFRLEGRIVVITGGGGFLGPRHAEAVLEAGGTPVLVDIDKRRLESVCAALKKTHGVEIPFRKTDITKESDIIKLGDWILKKYGRIDSLVNNAAIDPKVKQGGKALSRLENFSLAQWEAEVAVGLTGAFICSKILGAAMAKAGKGSIVNISSDLGLVAPDQRIYRKKGLPDKAQPAKPVTYSVIKHGLIGLTKYLATYWAEHGVRANALCPGGVYNEQPPDFVKKLTNLIPMGRMATPDEYKAALVFLASDASSYMTGAVIAVEGGRTCW